MSSEFLLPELATAGESSAPDVWIQKGHVPEINPHLFWKGESSIRVSRGQNITVDVFSGADELAVRLSILGPAFSKLLSQRGFLILHAGAVKTKKGAVAFLGASGAGKSTLVAALHAKGYSVVSDNFLAVGFHEGKPLVYSSFPQCKLLPDSIRALGYDVENLPRIERTARKRALALKNRFIKKPCPLKCIYILSEGKEAGIQDATPRQKLLSFITHSYNSKHATENKTLSDHFSHATYLINSIPMKHLKRTRDFSALPKLIQLIENDLGI